MTRLFPENCANEGEKSISEWEEHFPELDLFGKNALLMHDSYDLNMLICMKKLRS